MSNKNSLVKAVTIALPLAFSGATSPQAQGVVVIDNPNNTARTENYLARSCSSYFAQDVERCVNTQLSLTGGLADAFKEHLRQKNLGANYMNWFDSQCDETLNAAVRNTPPSLIDRNPPRYLPRFVAQGFLASRQCLGAIEAVGSVVGIDFNPRSRALLHDMIDSAERGSLSLRLFF